MLSQILYHCHFCRRQTLMFCLRLRTNEHLQHLTQCHLTSRAITPPPFPWWTFPKIQVLCQNLRETSTKESHNFFVVTVSSTEAVPVSTIRHPAGYHTETFANHNGALVITCYSLTSSLGITTIPCLIKPRGATSTTTKQWSYSYSHSHSHGRGRYGAMIAIAMDMDMGVDAMEL